jgi:hypothetical protein
MNGVYDVNSTVPVMDWIKLVLGAAILLMGLGGIVIAIIDGVTGHHP